MSIVKPSPHMLSSVAWTVPSRADLVEIGSRDPVDGTVANAGGLQYVRSAGATVLPGLPGWLPFGDWYLDHFGAVPDGITDCSPAFAAAVATSSSLVRDIHLGLGTYQVSEQIRCTRVDLRFVGKGPRSTRVRPPSNFEDDVFYFGKEQEDAPGMHRGCGIIGIGCVGDGTQTGFFLHVNGCVRFRGSDLECDGMVNGYQVSGGQLNALDNIRQLATGLSYTPGSCGFRGRHRVRSDGVIDQLYTLEVNTFSFTGGPSRSVEDMIDVQGADGINFVNGYTSFGKRSSVKLESTTSAQIASSLTFVNCFFDGTSFQQGGTEYGLYVPDTGSTGRISACFGAGVFFGQAKLAQIHVNTTKLGALVFNGVTFSNVSDGPIGLVSGSGSSSNVRFVGCRFSNATGGTELRNVAAAVVTNNVCSGIGNDTPLFNFSSNIGDLKYSGNAIRDGNSEVLFTALSKPNAPVTDWYDSGEYTPELIIGGQKTGITYSRQEGKYSRIGNVVTFSAEVVLTSKGALTGFVRFSLPFTPPGAFDINQSLSIWVNNGSGLSGRFLQAAVNPGTASAELSRILAGSTRQQLTEENIVDNTRIRISGSYFV